MHSSISDPYQALNVEEPFVVVVVVLVVVGVVVVDTVVVVDSVEDDVLEAAKLSRSASCL